MIKHTLHFLLILPLVLYALAWGMAGVGYAFGTITFDLGDRRVLMFWGIVSALSLVLCVSYWKFSQRLSRQAVAFAFIAVFLGPIIYAVSDIVMNDYGDFLGNAAYLSAMNLPAVLLTMALNFAFHRQGANGQI